VAETALRRGVPEDRVWCPVKANEPDFLDALRMVEPDLAVTAAYGNFLPRSFLEIPRLGTLIIHPSLLPEFRGAAPVQRALERGVDVTGVTVAFTVLEMDAGPVVRRVERQLDGSEKHGALVRELFHTGARALLEALPSVWTGEAASSATPQSAFGEPSRAPKVSSEEGTLRFKSETALELRNKVRGFDGWPGTKGAFAVKNADDGDDAWREVTLKILTANVCESGGAAAAAAAAKSPESDLVTLTKTSMRVPCAGGTWLEVTEVQPPGKKPMEAGAYANGLKGSVLKVMA
jgi:methionyl-tRNA formyltransferase